MHIHPPLRYQNALSQLRRAILSPGLVSEAMIFGVLLPTLVLWYIPNGLRSAVLLVLVLGPLWLGLRFGLLAGSLVAVTTSLAVFASGYFRSEQTSDFPNAQIVVMLLAGMVSGEMRDRWVQKTSQLTTLSHHYSNRLKQFSSAYQVLQISHAQLERRIVNSTGNLRGALQRLQQRTKELDSSGSLAESGLGPWLLEMFADLANLHSAALYAINERGVLQIPAVASLGAAGELSAFHPMLRETLGSAAPTVLRGAQAAGQGQLIAIIPLVDARAHVHAVVAIFDMLFVKIQQHTFEELSVLGQHMGDIMAGRPQAVRDSQDLGAFKDTLRLQFAQANSAVFPVSLVACTVTASESREALAAHLCRGTRGLDQCWVMTNRYKQIVVLKTMPLTDAEGV